VSRSRAANARTAPTLQELGQLIERELGIRMPPEKATLLECRLQRRVRALGLSSIAEYRDHLRANGHELTELIDAVTTNKTDFYREPAHFEFLTNVALPALTRRPGLRQLKVWCAGCSSGEEPYTLAMALSEHARSIPTLDFRILATDVSTRVLAQAKQGVYEQAQVDALPADWRQRYVAPSKDKTRKLARIRPELRKRVSFHRLNFMAPDYAVRDRFDVIFFRNVAIYFDAPTQANVITKLTAQLASGGYFFIGLSESLKTPVAGLQRVGPSIFARQ
jgi:chemotaxis protein methyltransferase CheR